MPDVVLIHPGGREIIYGTLAHDFAAVEQPLWCRLIAGFLIDHGVDVGIIDAEAEHLSDAQVAERVGQESPALIGIVVSGHQPSASSQMMTGASSLAKALKTDVHCPQIIMLGNHPSALPKRTLQEEEIDFVCDGEGPLTLMGLLEGKQKTEIPGLVYWAGSKYDKSEIICNPRAPLLDLDRDLHGNVWHLLKAPLYKSHNWQRLNDLGKRQPYAAVYTSLGCSYKCNFCMINVFQHTNRYRMRNPKAVVDEMIMLNREYGVETFKFTDELFIVNRRHTEAICNGIIEAGLGDKISSWCYARTDSIDWSMLPLYRKAGFDWFALGIESGSKRVRAAANKALKNDDEIVQSVRRIEAAGVNVISNFIFGLLTDDMESMQETLDLALELNTAFANFYPCQAFPGSALYDEALAKGWTLPGTWAGYSMHGYESRPLDTEHVTAAEVLRFRDNAFQTYFTNPAYLEMIDAKFGPATVAHIREMTSHKLKRKLLGDVS